MPEPISLLESRRRGSNLPLLIITPLLCWLLRRHICHFPVSNTWRVRRGRCLHLHTRPSRRSCGCRWWLSRCSRCNLLRLACRFLSRAAACPRLCRRRRSGIDCRLGGLSWRRRASWRTRRPLGQAARGHGGERRRNGALLATAPGGVCCQLHCRCRGGLGSSCCCWLRRGWLGAGARLCGRDARRQRGIQALGVPRRGSSCGRLRAPPLLARPLPLLMRRAGAAPVLAALAAAATAVPVRPSLSLDSKQRFPSAGAPWAAACAAGQRCVGPAIPRRLRAALPAAGATAMAIAAAAALPARAAVSAWRAGAARPAARVLLRSWHCRLGQQGGKAGRALELAACCSPGPWLPGPPAGSAACKAACTSGQGCKGAIHVPGVQSAQGVAASVRATKRACLRPGHAQATNRIGAGCKSKQLDDRQPQQRAVPGGQAGLTPAARWPGPAVVAAPLAPAASTTGNVCKPRLPATRWALLERRKRKGATGGAAVFVPPPLGTRVWRLPGVAPPAVPAAATALAASLPVPLPFAAARRRAFAGSTAAVAVRRGPRRALPLPLRAVGGAGLGVLEW